MQKNHFLSLKKWKNTGSAQLCKFVPQCLSQHWKATNNLLDAAGPPSCHVGVELAVAAGLTHLQVCNSIISGRELGISAELGALSVFFNFFNSKKWFYCIFYQMNNLFLHQSYLKSPLPVKLTWEKMEKVIFYYWKN